MSPLEAFSEAMRHAQPAGTRWLQRLGATDHATLSCIVERVPPQRMSQPARQFALEVMATNRRALLSLLEVRP